MTVISTRYNLRRSITSGSILVYLLIILLCNSCFKNLPVKNILYENDFETDDTTHIKTFNQFGPTDSLKIFSFNGSKVLGRFNTGFVLLTFEQLPTHNAVKVEFDLLIHDQWTGDHIQPGFTSPDTWQMTIDNYPVYLTTFSNGPYTQSFPDNHVFGTVSKNPARANAWQALPGVCGFAGKADGTSLYKIEYTTSHTGPLVIGMNDALQPYNSPCLKSWSIDNLRITAIDYH